MSAAKKTKTASSDLAAVYQALDRVQAIAEFECDGTVISANDNFLHMFGYARDEIIGHHHRIFCSPEDAQSPAYDTFWRKLTQEPCEADEAM